MNDFPTIMGREPRATGIFLIPRRSRLHVGTVLNAAWRARLRIMMEDASVYDFILLMRVEHSHKRCAPIQVRFLLYTLPFGFGKKTTHDSEGWQFFRETYYLPKTYNSRWLDFSESNFGDNPDFMQDIRPLHERRLAEIERNAPETATA